MVDLLDYTFDFRSWLYDEAIFGASLSFGDIKGGVVNVEVGDGCVTFWLKNPAKRSGTVTCKANTESGRVRQSTMRIQNGKVVGP